MCQVQAKLLPKGHFAVQLYAVIEAVALLPVSALLQKLAQSSIVESSRFIIGKYKIILPISKKIMLKVFVELSAPSVAISQLAGRLGGTCVNELCNLYQYAFTLESMADQFYTSVRHFPEVVRVDRLGTPIQDVITLSRLCDCGWTTRQGCEISCEAIADQNAELAA